MLRIVRARTWLERSFAIVTATWFVVATVLGLAHQAQVSHVVDPTTGLERHADAHLAGHRASNDSHVHSATGSEGDDDVCAILTALHRAIRAADPTPPAIAAPDVPSAPAPLVAEPRALAVAELFRLAPKTSPPALS